MFLFSIVGTLVLLAQLREYVFARRMQRHAPDAGRRPKLLLVAAAIVLATICIDVLATLADYEVGPWAPTGQPRLHITQLVLWSAELALLLVAAAIAMLARPRGGRSPGWIAAQVVLWVSAFGIFACYGSMMRA